MHSSEGESADDILSQNFLTKIRHRQLLGPERFKLINQAARDALEVGGFLPDKEDEAANSGGGSGKDKNRRARR